jgi:hypothetical protein
MPLFPRLMRIRLWLVFPFALVALALPAHAAASSGDVFFGYSRLGNDAFYPNVGGLSGWEGAVQVKIMPFVGVEADLAHYGIEANASVPRTTTVLFGPRVTFGAAGVHIFVHGLVGGEHSANSSGDTPVSGGALTLALGGGVDFRIAPRFAWRVAADYLNAPFETPGSGNHDRFTTGLVFRF